MHNLFQLHKSQLLLTFWAESPVQISLTSLLQISIAGSDLNNNFVHWSHDTSDITDKKEVKRPSFSTKSTEPWLLAYELKTWPLSSDGWLVAKTNSLSCVSALLKSTRDLFKFVHIWVELGRDFEPFLIQFTASLCSMTFQLTRP